MNDPSPRSLGFRWPAEWEPHAATWLSWPHNKATWPGAFDAAVREYESFVRAIADFESVRILAGGNARTPAEQATVHLKNVELIDIETNDAWIRDHGPSFVSNGVDTAIVDWQYNAWGEKYPPFDLDNKVPAKIAALNGSRLFSTNFILEPGSIDGNGNGTLLTTKNCLLNANRNPQCSAAEIEHILRDNLGVEKIIWLEGELPGDDTDGHVDQIARFVDETHIVVSTDDQQAELTDNAARIREFADANAIDLVTIELPLPPPIHFDGMRLPASYANFYVVNGGVLLPTFDVKTDATAIKIVQDCFPDRTVIPLPARFLSVGLGSFHCLTQQEPLVEEAATIQHVCASQLANGTKELFQDHRATESAEG